MFIVPGLASDSVLCPVLRDVAGGISSNTHPLLSQYPRALTGPVFYCMSPRALKHSKTSSVRDPAGRDHGSPPVCYSLSADSKQFASHSGSEFASTFSASWLLGKYLSRLELLQLVSVHPGGSSAGSRHPSPSHGLGFYARRVRVYSMGWLFFHASRERFTVSS